MNIKDFIKNNKIAVIAGSVVLAVAIASGVAFGVINHKNKVESKGFTPNGSSVSTGSDKSVSLPTDNSSKENTSGEASTGSDSTETTSSETTTSNETGNGSTIEVIPTPSKNSSSTSSNKPTSKPSASSSQPTTPAASTPATSTPSNTVSSTPSQDNTGGNTGGSTGGTTRIDPNNTPYGICKKCGTPNGILGHSDFTCQGCNKTYCNALYYANNKCPYCGWVEPAYICPDCGREIGTEKGQCRRVWDFSLGKDVCRDNH